MSEGTTGKFDFGAEVQRAFDEFPDLRYNLVFVSLAENTDDQAPLKIHAGSRVIGQVLLLHHAEDIREAITHAREKDCSVAGPVPHGGFSLIVLNDDGKMFRRYSFNDPDIAQFWAMNHEMGHLLVPGAAQATGEDPYAEAAADAFATIRCLQRFGRVPELDNTLGIRALRAIELGSAKRLSVPVIEQILQEDATTDFAKLTPDETVARAEKYARQHLPAPDAVERFKSTFAPVAQILDNESPDTLEKLDLLASTCLAAPDKFSFYIGLHALQPLLDPDNLLPVRWEQELAKKYRALLAERAREHGLQTLALEFAENRSDLARRKTETGATAKPATPAPVIKF